jgi:hypothetical protein
MTRAEYLSPERFPLTTVPGLPAEWQRCLDIANLAWLEEVAVRGGALSDRQRRRLQELRDKAAAFPSLRAEAERLRAWRWPDTASGEEAIPPPRRGRPVP